MFVTIIALAWLGLAMGSFVSAVVWRTRQQHLAKQKTKRQKATPASRASLSIFNGRSQCPHCGHRLAAKDLVPLLSWLALGGRCRYCHKPISKEYPLLELTLVTVFVISYICWPGGIYGAGEWLLFLTWLAASVGLMALLLYDLKWMLLPNKILYPTFWLAIGGRLSYILVFSADPAHDLWILALSLAVASGLFWLIFMISEGRWIGFGDVRLGLVLGTLLGKPELSFLMIFTAAILGTLAMLPALASNKKSLTSRIPFGPFLIIATFLVMLFGPSAIDWYKNLLT